MAWERDEVLWAAGFFDGEGCLYTAKQPRCSDTHRMWVMCIASTDLDMLERWQRIFNAGQIYGPRVQERCKPLWSYRLASPAKIYAIGSAILPFLCKRRKAKFREFMIYFRQYRYNSGQPRKRLSVAHKETLRQSALRSWERRRGLAA